MTHLVGQNAVFGFLVVVGSFSHFGFHRRPEERSGGIPEGDYASAGKYQIQALAYDLPHPFEVHARKLYLRHIAAAYHGETVPELLNNGGDVVYGLA